MLRNKIISIVALATIGPASPTAASLAVEAAGTEVADLAFAEADFAGVGSAFSVHTPTVTIPTIMLMTTRAVAIWSLGGSLRLAQPDSRRELVHMSSLLGFVTLIGSATEQVSWLL